MEKIAVIDWQASMKKMLADKKLIEEYLRNTDPDKKPLESLKFVHPPHTK